MYHYYMASEYMKAISILRKLPEAHAIQIHSPGFISCSESFIHLGSVKKKSAHKVLSKTEYILLKLTQRQQPYCTH